MPTKKVIMNSGRVYHLDEAESKKYVNGWLYYYSDPNKDDLILGLSKSNIEAEVWNDEKFEIGRVNDNGSR